MLALVVKFNVRDGPCDEDRRARIAKIDFNNARRRPLNETGSGVRAAWKFGWC